MKLSLKWLQECLQETFEPEQFARDLTMLGIEVEGLTKIAPPVGGVVTAKIESISRHPNADKLTVCRVNDGAGVLAIVCGAPNIKEGDVVPLAKVGAQLAGGITIKKAKIRGEQSEGMMCSEVELGLGTDKSGIFILPPATPLGRPLKDIFDVDDVILEISITPNRGDCLSLKGIAREICAMKRIPFEKARFLKGISLEHDPALDSAVQVEVSEEDLCPRYGYGIAAGVAIGPSPFLLRYRLSNCGIRPINNIVDITNAVMLELGHPMHAFDLDTLIGKKIIVRKSRRGEKIVTLDGGAHDLDDSRLVIADAERPVAVAGVMGGESTQVTEATKNVLFECAYFNPATVRRTARALGLGSESSYRFERGVDISDIDEATRKAFEMVQAMSAGSHRFSRPLSAGRKAVHKKKVFFRPPRANRVLGTDLPEREMESILSGLGFSLKEKASEGMTWEIPFHRDLDVEREIDLIEEVARVYGYTRIIEQKESAPASYKLPLPSETVKSRIMTCMTGQGFDEAVTYCFISRKESDAFAQDRSLVLELSNPISEDLRYLRTTLVPSLCKVAATNLNYGQQGVRIFETGAAYYSSGKEHPIQRPFLAFAVCGTRESRSPFEKNRPYDFFDLKGACETLADSLDISLEYRASSGRPYLKKEALDVLLKGEEIGILGGVQSGLLGQLYGIDKEVFYGEILIDNLPVINAFNKKYKALSRFPSVINDISFTLDKAILHKEVEETILSLNIKELENVYIYDIFEGKNIPEGKKSVTYTLRFRSENRTLTSEEVREKVDKVMDALQKRFRAELRTQKQGCLT